MLPKADRNIQAQVTRSHRGPWFQFRGPIGFEWTSIRLPIPGLPPGLEGLRVLHLTDLHLRGYWSRAFDDLILGVQKKRADLLLITGDFVDDKQDHQPALPILKRLIPQLTTRLGTFAILGNHDVDLAEVFLREMGVNLIDGGRARLDSKDAAIELIGLPGVARHDLDPHFILDTPARNQGDLRIVLSHYPDHIRRIIPLQADIVLAGHTHGGQICWPGGKPLITHDHLPKTMAKGVFRVGRTWLIVSRGFGFAGIPARFFCPAEVAEITLVRA